MHSAKDLVEQYHLEMRWRCLSLAADLDRVERATGGSDALKNDVRMQKLRRAIAALLQEQTVRTEAVQNIFSDMTPPPPYKAKG